MVNKHETTIAQAFLKGQISLMVVVESIHHNIRLEIDLQLMKN